MNTAEAIKEKLKQLRDSINGLCYLGEDKEKELIEEALSALSAASAEQQPVAWVRYHSDGGYEGPIMDSDFRMCDVRRKSGAWTPLVHPSAPQASQPVEEVRKELESMTRMFHAACADLGQINEALGLDPDDGGAEPILDAIEELKAQASQPAMKGMSDIIAWLDSLHETTDSGAVTNRKWPVAQQAIAAIKGDQASLPTLSHAAYLVLTAVAEDENEPKHRRDAAREAINDQASQPVALTDEQIMVIYKRVINDQGKSLFEFARAVESALLSATSQPSAWDAAIEAAAKEIESYEFMLDRKECATAIRALRQQAPAQTAPQEVHYCPRDVGVCGNPSYCRDCPNRPKEAAQTAPVNVPEHLREFVEAIAEGFTETHHQTQESFCSHCGVSLDNVEAHKPDCIKLRAKSLLSAAPSAPAQTAPVNVPSGWQLVPIDHHVAPKVFDKMVLGAMKLFADEGFSPSKWSGNHTALVRSIIAGATAHQERFPASFAEELSAAPSAPIAANSEDAGWISVDDRLPDGELSLCLVTGWAFNDPMKGRYFTLARFSKGVFYEELTGDDLYFPTHWMPTPPLPIAATAQQKGGE